MDPRDLDTEGNPKTVLVLEVTLIEADTSSVEALPPSVHYDSRIMTIRVAESSVHHAKLRFCIGCGAPLNEGGCAICTPSDGHAGRYEGAMVAPRKVVDFLRRLGYPVDGYENAAAFERAHFETHEHGSVGFQTRS